MLASFSLCPKIATCFVCQMNDLGGLRLGVWGILKVICLLPWPLFAGRRKAAFLHVRALPLYRSGFAARVLGY
jgi:hypothetical protein